MDINELAKHMRDRALLIEGDEQLDERSLRDFAEVKVAREQKLKRIEDIKKLHFNAGRWVGGARDYTAREAFMRLKASEK
jgi:anthranilate phosphoribosyltransferase